MFKNLFSKKLRLEFSDRTVNFATVSDFEFSLASRTEVPAGKITDLVRKSPEALTREASSIRQLERQFVDLLSKSMEEPGSISHLLRGVDLKLFSQDHEWRTIFTALTKLGKAYDDYKQLALVKYTQYLGSRQEVLKSIFENKYQLDAVAAELNAAGPDFKETVIFESRETALRSPRDSGLKRLPRGETVTIQLDAEADLQILLSRHKFSIVSGQQLHLVDENGTDYALQYGRNRVGREQGNDVIVDPAYRDVSRKHLIIDVESPRHVRLTDLSSHGTYVPGTLLGPTNA
ncbi:MAG: FHA domain-containing protein [Gammaproteobacteria bacterium]|nr:FHA domain-containing protein [Gammaproteobacteria bacterium]